MSKVRLVDKNSNWGGVLNITFYLEMDPSKIQSIIKDIEQLFKGKFYTINIYDAHSSRYLSDAELIFETEDKYVLLVNSVDFGLNLFTYRYELHKNGGYKRQYRQDKLLTQ